MNKIILTTGGTGGHIFPAIATAQAIKRKFPKAEILFIGSLYGPEAEYAAHAGLQFIGLPVRGVMGRGLRAVPAIFQLGVAFCKALNLINNFKPDAIAGFGGYASFAPILAAGFLRVPILLHEQNAIAGASNKFLAKLASRVCVSLPATSGFNRPCVVTGNPVREEIENSGNGGREFGNTKRLLVLGGSQGAHAVNRLMREVAPALQNAGIEIRHQTGAADYEDVAKTYAGLKYVNAKCEPFIKDMAGAYSWTDLVLCRSGASTIAELCVTGAPAVLVPFPAAIHNHQTINASVLEKAGAAVLKQENELNKDNLTPLLEQLLANPARLESMSQAARSCGAGDAASRLANELAAISKK